MKLNDIELNERNPRLIKGVMFDKLCRSIATFNEDFTSSISEGVVGKVIMTVYLNSITQKQTQSNKGGLTELYLRYGTYVKSFYSVIAHPSCVKISVMGDTSKRIHHKANWKNAVPMIIREEHRKL